MDSLKADLHIQYHSGGTLINKCDSLYILDYYKFDLWWEGRVSLSDTL